MTAVICQMFQCHLSSGTGRGGWQPDLLWLWAALIHYAEKNIICFHLFHHQVFEAMVAWIKHDKEARLEHMPKLMEHVRLPLLSRDYLVQVRSSDFSIYVVIAWFVVSSSIIFSVRLCICTDCGGGTFNKKQQYL